jgi:hypothetical protein
VLVCQGNLTTCFDQYFSYLLIGICSHVDGYASSHLRSAETELENLKEELVSLRRVRVELMEARAEVEQKKWLVKEKEDRAAAERVALEEELEHWKAVAGDRSALRDEVEVSASSA